MRPKPRRTVFGSILLPTTALALAACGPATAPPPRPGLVAAREGASSGGMAHVVASDIPPPSSGGYPSETVNVETAPSPGGNPRPGPSRPPTPIALGSTVSGRFEANDPTMDEQSSRVDDYVFIGSAGQWVTIDLVGGDMDGAPGSHLDCILHLLANGREVASDDDSGGNLNSRIELQLPTSGMYIIRATTYGGDARLGPYTLSVRAGRNAPPPPMPPTPMPPMPSMPPTPPSPPPAPPY